jgi:hypothetical protein
MIGGLPAAGLVTAVGCLLVPAVAGLLAASIPVLAPALPRLDFGADECETENRDDRTCPCDQFPSHCFFSLKVKQNSGPAGQSSCEEQTSRHYRADIPLKSSV